MRFVPSELGVHTFCRFPWHVAEAAMRTASDQRRKSREMSWLTCVIGGAWQRRAVRRQANAASCAANKRALTRTGPAGARGAVSRLIKRQRIGTRTYDRIGARH